MNILRVLKGVSREDKENTDLNSNILKIRYNYGDTSNTKMNVSSFRRSKGLLSELALFGTHPSSSTKLFNREPPIFTSCWVQDFRN